MSIDDIRVLKNAKPFEPFDILTNDGRVRRIPFPHRIALSPRGESIAGFAEDGSFFLMLSDVIALKPRSRRKTKRS